MTVRGMVRAAFYLYFSWMCTVVATAAALLPWLQLGDPVDYLLGEGPGAVGGAAFLLVMAILFLNSIHKFNQPINLRKWIALCIIATVLGVLAFVWTVMATLRGGL